MKNNVLSIIAVLLLLILMSGCNTLSGMGKDVESAGKSVQKAAD